MKAMGKREMARVERELVVCLTEACETAKAEICRVHLAYPSP